MADDRTARAEEGEDEDEGGPALYLAELQERRRRDEHTDNIQRFLSVTAEREAELLSLLHWLSETEESLQDCVNNKQVCKDLDVTEWVEDSEEKFDKLLVDVNCAINRLCTICQNLFETESKKRKMQAAQKTGVWRLLKDQKLDPKMMKRIQKLQPPTADKFLADASLASRSSTELTLMLNDIAKGMSSNKATDMALRFFQMGLQNLIQAFQERTTEVKSLNVQIEEMKTNDCQFELAQLKMEITDSNMKLSKLQKELDQIKEHNAALMLENEAITVRNRKQEKKSSESQLDSPSFVKFFKQKKKVPDQKDVEHSFINSLSLSSQLNPDLADDSPHDHVSIPMNVEYSEEAVPRTSSDTPNRSQQDHTNMNVELFPKNGDHLKLKSAEFKSAEFKSEVYMELQFDVKTPESELLQNAKLSPSEMLRVIIEENDKYELAVKDAGHQLQAVVTENTPSDRWQNSLSFLLNQFKNINKIGRKQVWNMQLLLKLLQEIHSNTTQKDKQPAKEELISHDAFSTPIPFHGHSPVRSPSMTIYQKEEVVKMVKKQIQPDGTIMNHKPELTVNNKPAESVIIMDFVERYIKEIEVEGERLLKTKMKRFTHVINVKCQRRNLRLLNQAYVNRNISPRLYYLARDVVLDSLASVNMRIACLFQRYTSHIALQQFRKNLDSQLQQARELNNGKAFKNLSCLLPRLNDFQQKVTRKWTEKQIVIDQRRLKCLARMTYLFQQMRMDYRLQLAPPYICQRGLLQPLLSVTPWRIHWSLNLDLTQNLWHVSRGPCHAPPNSPSFDPYCCYTTRSFSSEVHSYSLASFQKANTSQERKSGLVTGNIWQAKDSANSMWLASQVPPVSARDSGTVPLLLEMDVNHERISATRNLLKRL